MADIQTIDVTALDRAESVKGGDTLLLVRQMDDGTQKCLRVDGASFRGEDAYTVAQAAGYGGTREEWEEQVARASRTSVGVDPETGEIVIDF